MEIIKTVVDQSTAKELSKRMQLLAIGAIAFGFVCIGLYVLFGFLNNSWGDILNIVLLVLGCFLIALSGMLEFGLLKRINLYKNNGYESTYEFLDDHIELKAYRNGEQFQNAKIKYQDIACYIEMKNYIVIKLNNMNALPVSKVSGLTEFLDSKGIIRRRK